MSATWERILLPNKAIVLTWNSGKGLRDLSIALPH